MMLRGAGVVVGLVILGACGDNAPAGGPGDGSIDGAGGAWPAEPVCAHRGSSSVVGAGPAGSLEPYRVYAGVLGGFCPESLDLRLTADDPLTTESEAVRILATVTPGSFWGTAEWSGTFPATIPEGYMAPEAHGTLEVHRATPVGPSGSTSGTRLSATVRFDEGGWRFTATIDGPYCFVTTCI